MSSERLVVTALLQVEEYARRTVAFLQPDYFELEASKRIYEVVKEYLAKYKSHPNRITVETKLHTAGLDENALSESLELVEECYGLEPPDNLEWALDTTEAWCKDRALFNAINKSITIYQGDEKKFERAAISVLVREALSVSFDRSLGLDFYDGAERRWNYYTQPENKIPFRIDVLNDITDGGVTRKSLNIVAAGINVGKSMTLCALASDYVRSGYKVLYITCEMREEMTMQRVDANLLNTPANLLKEFGLEAFVDKVTQLRQKSYGNIKIKEYAPGIFTALMLDALLDEYLTLEGFDPDIIMVDYVQICASFMLKKDVGSYHYYKSVAEELRGVAVRRDKVMWSVSQFNRSGNENSDPSMTDTGESMGIPATADGMWAVMRTEELDQIGQLSWKQLKSRYANKAHKPTFRTGIDVDRFQLLNVEEGSARTMAPKLQNTNTSGNSVKDKFSKLKFGDNDS